MYSVLNYPLPTENSYQLSPRLVVSVFLAAISIALGVMGVSYIDGISANQLASPLPQ